MLARSVKYFLFSSFDRDSNFPQILRNFPQPLQANFPSTVVIVCLYRTTFLIVRVNYQLHYITEKNF
jgi:hypothetical protein